MTVPDKKVQGRKASAAEKQLAEKRKQQAKFYGVVTLLTLLCCGFIYFIFRPTPDATLAENGLIMTVPDASAPATEGDKQKAYENAEHEKRQREKMQTLQEMQGADADYLTSQPQGRAKSSSEEIDAIRQSQQTYRQVSQQMNSFYSSSPRKNSEVDELKKQVAELAAQLEKQKAVDNELDPVAMMEKSYELAAKYSANNSTKTISTTGTPVSTEKRSVAAVHRAKDNVVSALTEDFELTPDRNYGFNTAVGTNSVLSSNAVRACVSEDQVLTSGGRIKLRLLEPLMVGDIFVPENAPIYGTTRIEGQRLSVVVSFIEWENNILPVELNGYDMDGQAGLFVPNTAERQAIKEAAANIGSGFGSSISFTNNASQQLAMDLTRGVLTGGSQYLATKMREIKVTVKANYQILLISKK